MRESSELFNEFSDFRSPPAVPYKWAGAVLSISPDVVTKTLAAFSLGKDTAVEACCFWYGKVLDAEKATVEGILIPKQTNYPGWYNVESSAMAKISRATLSRGWTNLAQIHTHPGSWVEHSSYDDIHANSRWALSIVFPHYGHWVNTWPEGVGVHEFQGGNWHNLIKDDVRRRIVMEGYSNVISLVDLR